MFKMIANLRERIRQQERIDFYTLPFPSFPMDTRSSPLEVGFELDLRNDRSRAAWSERWRTLVFNEGRYGALSVEESVGARRPATGKPQKAAAAKVHRLNGPLAA